MADRPDGIIKDENQDFRYDAGEAAKDQYERADPYEKDRIELRGIAFFTIGLILLIGVTFGLMWLLQVAMVDQLNQAYEKERSPMSWTEEEKKSLKNLPPEPRLQAAPGFQVENPNGGEAINLELREPQAEYRELKKQWDEVLKNGRKDPQTGTVITLPIEEAKKAVIQGNVIKIRPADQAQKASETVTQIPSYQSAGRATEIRRQ